MSIQPVYSDKAVYMSGLFIQGENVNRRALCLFKMLPEETQDLCRY